MHDADIFGGVDQGMWIGSVCYGSLSAVLAHEVLGRQWQAHVQPRHVCVTRAHGVKGVELMGGCWTCTKLMVL